MPFAPSYTHPVYWIERRLTWLLVKQERPPIGVAVQNVTWLDYGCLIRNQCSKLWRKIIHWLAKGKKKYWNLAFIYGMIIDIYKSMGGALWYAKLPTAAFIFKGLESLLEIRRQRPVLAFIELISTVIVITSNVYNVTFSSLAAESEIVFAAFHIRNRSWNEHRDEYQEEFSSRLRIHEKLQPIDGNGRSQGRQGRVRQIECLPLSRLGVIIRSHQITPITPGRR